MLFLSSHPLSAIVTFRIVAHVPIASAQLSVIRVSTRLAPRHERCSSRDGDPAVNLRGITLRFGEFRPGGDKSQPPSRTRLTPVRMTDQRISLTREFLDVSFFFFFFLFFFLFWLGERFHESVEYVDLYGLVSSEIELFMEEKLCVHVRSFVRSSIFSLEIARNLSDGLTDGIFMEIIQGTTGRFLQWYF